jgi:hypothetical protein
MVEGAVVKAHCSRCERDKAVDLGPIAEKMGRDFSLWNRRPKCATCGERVFFWAMRPGAGTWPTNMTDD